jgi:1-acyl-sn-glycerol-3-phosphate acyltransferase
MERERYRDKKPAATDDRTGIADLRKPNSVGQSFGKRIESIMETDIFYPGGKLSKKERLKRKFFHKREPVMQMVVEGLTALTAPTIKVGGKENLKKAIETNQGRNIVFIANHLSNFDASAILQVLRRTGFGEIAEKLIFLQGIKLNKTPVANILLQGFNVIPVWPPTLTPKNKEEEEKRMALTRESLIDAKKALKQGYNLLIFAEGGRSRDGTLGEAEPAITSYLTLEPGTQVVPVAISGTEEALPPGGIIPRPSVKIRVDFGKPIDIASLMTEYKNISHHERKKRIMDLTMRNIAKLLPAKYRGTSYS